MNRPGRPTSAGLLMFRRRNGGIEVFLVHPGGPLFRKRDEGVWGIPKGLLEDGEEGDGALLEAARREFREETGFAIQEPLMPLGSVRQKSGKEVHAWAFEADVDPAAMASNRFPWEWPPHSGVIREYPEVDRGAYFSISEARGKMIAAQQVFLDRLLAKLQAGGE